MDSIDLLKRALLDLAAVSEEGEGDPELVYKAWAQQAGLDAVELIWIAAEIASGSSSKINAASAGFILGARFAREHERGSDPS